MQAIPDSFPLRMRAVLQLLCIPLLLTFAACRSASEPAAPVVEAPAAKAPAAKAPDPVVTALERIEDGGRVVKVFTAKVAMERTEPLFDKRDVRLGDVLYERTSLQSPPRFAVHLEQRQIGRRLENRPKRILFNGRWLTEIDETKKQVIRWELCGDEVDPTRLGGRFPLPVGQPAEEVLSRYEVVLLEGGPTDEFLVGVATDRELLGLRITPRPGVPTADDFKHVDLWYDTDSWLPVAVSLVDEQGNTRRLRLDGARVNPVLDAEERERLEGVVPTTGEWLVDERHCVEPVAPDGGS